MNTIEIGSTSWAVAVAGRIALRRNAVPAAKLSKAHARLREWFNEAHPRGYIIATPRAIYELLKWVGARDARDRQSNDDTRRFIWALDDNGGSRRNRLNFIPLR